GATWSPAQTVSTGVNRLVPHGKTVSTSKGTMFFSYSTTGSAYMILSTDGGDTWIVSKIKDAAEFDTAVFAEPYAVHVGGDRVILVARDESTAGSTAIVFSSVD